MFVNVKSPSGMVHVAPQDVNATLCKRTCDGWHDLDPAAMVTCKRCAAAIHAVNLVNVQRVPEGGQK